MDARQTAVQRAALAYGSAFVTVLPDPADPARPAIRGVSLEGVQIVRHKTILDILTACPQPDPLESGV
jgi:hypothetical protein